MEPTLSPGPGRVGAGTEIVDAYPPASGLSCDVAEPDFRTALGESRRSPYDAGQLERELSATGSRLVYLPETTSTMDVGRRQGLVPSVVIADHQTAGRGRYSREWMDVAEKDVLVTYVKLLPREAQPKKGSPVLSQLFVLAAWSALQELYADPAIQIRWPNDLTAHGQKLGGILLMEGERMGGVQAVLFGLGVNVHNLDSNGDFKHTDYGAISLDEFHPSGVTRSDIIVAVHKELDEILPDLPGLGNPATFAYYAELWNEAAALKDRRVRISGLGRDSDETVSGQVLATPFGGGIEVAVSDGSCRVVTEFGPKAKLEVLA